jgi:xylulokinase
MVRPAINTGAMNLDGERNRKDLVDERRLAPMTDANNNKNTPEQIVIGVDGGTTAVKAVAFDLQGHVHAVQHRSVPVVYGSSGQAEQDMDAIWLAVAACLKDVHDALPSAKIVGIGLTGQGDGAWLVDENGHPVRMAATWLDGRASTRVDEWVSDGRADRVLKTTGTAVFSGLFPVLYDELKSEDPEVVERARTQLYCKDWLRFKLTGERITDYTEASRTYLDVESVDGYSIDLIASLQQNGVERLLPPIRRADALGGLLSHEASILTGIPEGTPVGVGMIDVAVTGMGLGAIENGQSWLILGTTGFVGTLLPSIKERHTNKSMVVATGYGQQVLEFLAPMTGSPNLDWIKRMLGFTDLSWNTLECEARTVAPGAGGVIYLPYASPGGERAPFLDSDASASWMGLSLTTPTAQLLRAVYEGIAFSLIECVNLLDISSYLIVSGGGFRSDLLCQIIADATGKTVLRQDAPEAGARGAAVLALVSCGVAPNVQKASQMLETGIERFEPEPQNYAVYKKTHEVYVAARKAIQPVWPAMRNLRHQ